MPRGPLPKPDKARRNAPTIPTTKLPAAGRQGRSPNPPKWTVLAESGKAWWKWAWKTPQAAAWSAGDLAVIARRAQLEDDVHFLDSIDNLDAIELLGAEEMREIRAMIRRLGAVATGRIAVLREMRELDNLLGLTPKGMATLRWQIVADMPKEDQDYDGLKIVG